MDCCSRTSAPGVAQGWLPWGLRGGDRARTKWLRPTKDTGGGGGGRYERQRQRREELLAAASRRDRPGRRPPFKISPGKRGKSLGSHQMVPSHYPQPLNSRCGLNDQVLNACGRTIVRSRYCKIREYWVPQNYFASDFTAILHYTDVIKISV